MQNSFSRYIFETEYFPHARTRRTFLWQKFIDFFNVIYGDISTIKEEPTFGLFDIMSIGILGTLARLDAFITKRYNNLMEDKSAPISNWEKALYWSSTVVNFIFNTMPRFIISGLLALVAFLPITLPVHLISGLVDRFTDSGLSTALSLKMRVQNISGDMIEKTLDEALTWRNPYNGELSHWDIEKINVEYNEKKQEAEFYISQPGSSHFYVKIIKTDDQKHYPHPIKAVFANNIGNIENKCPQIAREIAEELNTSEENGLEI